MYLIGCLRCLNYYVVGLSFAFDHRGACILMQWQCGTHIKTHHVAFFFHLFPFEMPVLSLFTTAMASIFANALRTQARLALVGSRAAVLPYASSFTLVSRRSIPSFAARSLSSQVTRADLDYSEIGRSHTEPNETLYLGNLPFSIGERELRDLLSDFGEIKDIRMGQFPCLFIFILSSIFLFFFRHHV